MAIHKTEYLQLTMDDPTEAYSVERVNANTKKIDSKFKLIDESLKNRAMDDEHVQCLTRQKKLNVVLDEIYDELSKKITLEQAPQPKNYDEAIKLLQQKDKDLLDLIMQFKLAMDGYFGDLGTEVERHKEANDRLEALL